MTNRATTVQQEFIKEILSSTKNDAEACRALGFSSAQLAHYKIGRRCADDESIISMAQFLGKNPEEAVRQHRAEQAKTPEMRRFWLSFGKAAAAIMIAIGLSSALLPSDAFATPTLPGKPDVLKIMRSHECTSQGCLLAAWLAIHMFVRYGSGR
ncbi:hypothetical protein CO615_09735 [Lysobacteraceae bacterium NML75-0749]|nr:hypothetical protein CO615_09735 [Xanthomonadaceae bacterium NML75-0749]